MAIKVSYYGSKKPAPNVKPQRVINLADNTPRDKLPFGGNNPLDWMTGKRQFQLKKEEPVEIKTGKSVTLSEDGVIELKGDSNTPGDSKVYSTDESGNRGWHDAPKSIPDGTADGQLLVWDNETKTWGPELIKLLPDGSVSKQILVWDNETKTWVASNQPLPMEVGWDNGKGAFLWLYSNVYGDESKAGGAVLLTRHGNGTTIQQADVYDTPVNIVRVSRTSGMIIGPQEGSAGAALLPGLKSLESLRVRDFGSGNLLMAVHGAVASEGYAGTLVLYRSTNQDPFDWGAAPHSMSMRLDRGDEIRFRVVDREGNSHIYAKIPYGIGMSPVGGDTLIYNSSTSRWVPGEYFPATDSTLADVGEFNYPRSIEVDKRTFHAGGVEIGSDALMLYDFWSASNKTSKTLVDLLTGNPAIRNKCKVVIRYHDDDDDGRPVVTYLPLGQLLTPPTVPDPDTVKGGITNGKSINFTGSNAYQIFNFFTGPSDGMTLSELVDPETLPADKNKYKLLARKDEVTGPEVAYVDIGDLGTLPDGTADGQLMQWNATSEEWELVETSTITVMTGWRLNKSTHRFQVKTTEIEVVASGTQSAWTDISDADGGILDEGTPL